MDPIKLNRNLPSPEPMSPMEASYPHVFLDNLKDVDIPEEGEIRFRYSRRRKTETEDRTGETMSVELCLKAITDICDCKGRDAENNDPENNPVDEKDAEAALERIMSELDEEELEEEDEY